MESYWSFSVAYSLNEIAISIFLGHWVAQDSFIFIGGEIIIKYSAECSIGSGDNKDSIVDEKLIMLEYGL